MTKAIAQTYKTTHEYSREINAALIAACALFLMIYSLNVYRVVSRTVALKSVENQTATLTTAVDGLDSQYLQLTSKLSPDTLHDYGLSQGQVSAFISRTTSLGSVASRDHEF
jgi:hypothetical protein